MNKKLTKQELKDQITIIINTVNSDYHEYERALLSNEALSQEDYAELNESGRALALQALQNTDHIMRKLCELTHNI